MLVAMAEFSQDRAGRSAIGIEEQPHPLTSDIAQIFGIEPQRSLFVGPVFDKGLSKNSAIPKAVQLVDPIDRGSFLTEQLKPIGDLAQIATQRNSTTIQAGIRSTVWAFQSTDRAPNGFAQFR